MSDEIPKKYPSVPREFVVKYENSLRRQEDNWLFRQITNVLRQNKEQIEKYRIRYEQK